MQTMTKQQFCACIQQTFTSERRYFAIRLLISLDDLSLHNIEFVDLLQDFAPMKDGFSKNYKTLLTMNEHELLLIQRFLLEIFDHCPSYFIKNVRCGIHTIQHIFQKETLVS